MAKKVPEPFSSKAFSNFQQALVKKNNKRSVTYDIEHSQNLLSLLESSQP
ncbi:hypothetical protein MICAH_2870001 [Microcystis aeruginosa PCC 9809]|uniref:Uncharacterized protein n=1 Tax=Microcystis aeruginosa PCC 9809 TaxID=1160285 RepID=I4HQJ0_MICAE|nr:hypothetical protein MICAH_2870001 [Microcystis aeruginosa PCC 9809]